MVGPKVSGNRKMISKIYRKLDHTNHKTFLNQINFLELAKDKHALLFTYIKIYSKIWKQIENKSWVFKKYRYGGVYKLREQKFGQF